MVSRTYSALQSIVIAPPPPTQEIYCHTRSDLRISALLEILQSCKLGHEVALLCIYKARQVAELTRSYLFPCLDPKASFHMPIRDSSHDGHFEEKTKCIFSYYFKPSYLFNNRTKTNTLKIKSQFLNFQFEK